MKGFDTAVILAGYKWVELFQFTPWLNQYVGENYGLKKMWTFAEVDEHTYCFLFKNPEDATAFRLKFNI